MDGITVAVGGDAGDDGAEQDREEGAAFDQRVGRRQFPARQQVGQDAVFDRAEQRGERAEQQHRDEQNRQRVQREAGDRDNGGAKLDELDALRDKALVVAVGELAAEPGQEEERRDQRRAGERDERRGIGAGGREQNDEDERGLEKIVAEGGAELAPEQRRETARRHQGHGHAVLAVRLPDRWLYRLTRQRLPGSRAQSNGCQGTWRRGLLASLASADYP